MFNESKEDKKKDLIIKKVIELPTDATIEKKNSQSDNIVGPKKKLPLSGEFSKDEKRKKKKPLSERYQRKSLANEDSASEEKN